MKYRFLAVALAALLLLAPARIDAGVIIVPPPISSGASPIPALGIAACVTGIILAAIDASRKFNRELTPVEAASCGVLYWINFASLRP